MNLLVSLLSEFLTIIEVYEGQYCLLIDAYTHSDMRTHNRELAFQHVIPE